MINQGCAWGATFLADIPISKTLKISLASQSFHGKLWHKVVYCVLAGRQRPILFTHLSTGGSDFQPKLKVKTFFSEFDIFKA